MVRVLSVYHFLSQTINSIKDEDIVDIIILNSRKLIIARTNHTIEIVDLHKLNAEAKKADQSDIELSESIGLNIDDNSSTNASSTTFSTVDNVLEIVYCKNGNYIATLEKNGHIKSTSRKLNKFVRIYVNWDCSKSANLSDIPLRARIAGKVTPLHKNANTCLEMIELPLEYEPKIINCCQSTGNLLISSNKNLLFYQFQMRCNDTTKQQFVDFIFIPIVIELFFIPKKIELIENLIIYMSDANFHMFKLNKFKDDYDSSIQDYVDEDNDDEDDEDYESKLFDEENEDADDFENSVTTNTDSEYLVYDNDNATYAYWEDSMINEKNKKGNIKYNVDYRQINRSRPLNDNIVFVDIQCNSSLMNKSSICDEIRPTVLQSMIINIKCLNEEEKSSSNKYLVENVLQLDLKPQKIHGILRQPNDKFTCIATHPLYSSSYLKKQQSSQFNTDNFFLLSKFNKHFLGCVVMITTQHDGYLFLLNKKLKVSSKQVSQDMSPTAVPTIDQLTTIYPFTSNVLDVKLDDKILHALTESGIETYTLNICEILGNYHKKIFLSSPNQISLPIYLIGLRPIFGLKKLLIDNFNENLLLISQTINKNVSIYDLKLPTINILYNEFMKFAKIQDRFSNFYLELLKQSNLFLLITMELEKLSWSTSVEENDNKLLKMISSKDASLELIYRESCIALGNYFVMSSLNVDYQNALKYYNLANMSTTDIFAEIINNECNNSSSNFNNQLLNVNGGKGLLYILQDFLLKQQNTNSQQLENIFTKCIKQEKFIDLLINFYDKSNNLTLLCDIVLKTIHLHDYMDEKLFKIIMENKLHRDEDQFEDNENLFIVFYLIKKNMNPTDVIGILNRIDLYNMMLAYWIILFDTILVKKKSSVNGKQQQQHVISNFSEFTEFLILRTNNTVILKLFNDTLLHLIFNLKKFSFSFILKLYLEFISTKLGISDSNNNNNNKNCLKLFLEKYFYRYYSADCIHFSDDSSKPLRNVITCRAPCGMQNDNDQYDVTTNASWGTSKTLKPMSLNDSQLNGTSSNSSSVNSTATNQNFSKNMKKSFAQQHHEGLKILIRLYLSQLRATPQTITQPENPIIISELTPELIEDNFNNFVLNSPRILEKYDSLKNDILFYEKRLNFLNLMLPFSVESSNANESLNILYTEKSYETLGDNILVLIKLQAILCSEFVTSDIIMEIQQFIQQSSNNNINLIGIDSIKCLLNILTIDKKNCFAHRDNLQILLNIQPHIVLEYGKCLFKTDLDWSNLIQMINATLLKLEENEEENLNSLFLYHRLLKEIFQHLATTKTRDNLQTIYNYSLNLYDDDGQVCAECIMNMKTISTLDFNNYLKICVDKERSDKLRQMIMNAGHQLWEAINKHRIL